MVGNAKSRKKKKVIQGRRQRSYKKATISGTIQRGGYEERIEERRAEREGQRV
jgi:hypothetical protein